MALGRKTGGRTKGTPNKTNRVAREKAMKAGPTPLEIMLDVARYHFDRAKMLRRRRGANRDELEIRAENILARESAEKAAPYLHSRLATLQSNVNLEGRLTIADLVNQSYEPPKAANENQQATSASAVGVDKSDAG